MYGFVRSWLGRNAGLVAAVAYMAIPYHLVDVYVRAAMAESVALIFLPLALWGFRETVVRPRLAAVIGAAFAYAAIMWTSNLVALVFTPGLALYVLVLWLWRVRDERRKTDDQRPTTDDQRKPSVVHPTPLRSGDYSRLSSVVRPLLFPAAAFALGLGLSAAFFIPALIEQRYINQTQWFGKYYDPFQHFVYFFQLFNPAWGFGISQPGPDDIAQGAMSYQLGAAATLLSVIALVLAGRQPPARRREIWFWGAWAAVSVFLTLGVSAFAWRYVPIVRFAQFPWRYLMLAILPLSILPGTLIANGPCGWRIANSEQQTADAKSNGIPAIRNPRSAIRNHLWPAIILALLLLLSSAAYFKVEMREPTKEQGPVSMAALMRFQRTSDEMTGVTSWVDPTRIPNWSPLADEWEAGRNVVTRADYSRIPQNKTLAVNAEGMGSQHDQVWYYAEAPDQTITFNRFWYPGWNAYLLDDEERQADPAPGGAPRGRPAGARRRACDARPGLHPAPLRGYPAARRRQSDHPRHAGADGALARAACAAPTNPSQKRLTRRSVARRIAVTGILSSVVHRLSSQKEVTP